MTAHYVVFAKYNAENHTIIVMRQDHNRRQEVLTRQSDWIEWTPTIENNNRDVVIWDVSVINPKTTPPPEEP
jgi:hypothetical protein